MSEQKLDEVDGECPVSIEETRNRLKVLKHPDLEKSLIDSGMDEGSNSGSIDTGISGENSDEDDDVVLRKPKKTMHRILDDDSDISQDVTDLSREVTDKEEIVIDGMSSQEETVDPRFDMAKEVIDLKEKRKNEFTPEQALDVIMQNSSDDDSDDDDDTPSKKKRVKRPVVDSSSDEDENTSLMDTIKKHSTTTGTDDLFDAEETKPKNDDDSDSDNDDASKRKVPDNLFNDSDSSGCKSSGSEVEKSDNEDGDEGFDESAIDPKLLAKLKKGAGKKPKKNSKREELQSIHSESQRIVREARVNMPYHQPAPKSLNDFLARANKKQHEYKILKGFRDTTKANLMQDILQNARLQNRAKTQEELDKYSDSDEDWNPEEEDDKKLKDRIDERLRNKSGGGMPLGEIKIDNAGNDNSNQSSVIVAEVDDEMEVEDNEDDLPDICDNTEKNDKRSNKSNTDATKSVPLSSSSAASISVPSNVDEDSEQGYELLVESVKVDAGNTENDSCVQTKPECIPDNAQAMCSKDMDKETESVASEKAVNETNTNTDTPDDLLFDWEKNDTENSGEKSKAIDNECTESRGSDLFKLDDNKENIDPNGRPIEAAKAIEVLTPSQKDNKKSSPRSSAKKKKSKIAALAGIDLDNVKPCLSGNSDTFITLEEEEEVPKHPGVKKLMDRLTKHSTKTEKKQQKDIDISIISKDVVGIDKEELKFDTFTYHGDDEDANPLMKYEAPGAKLVALKEQLQEKMKARREMARQKRQEVYDLDNEEGGYDAEEEAEMSEHSDTDIEDEDFEEQYGDDEELIEEEEKEKNPFADDEADEDGDDDGEEGEVADEFEDDEEYNLKLDVTDDEQSEDDEVDNEEKSKPGDDDTEDKLTEFKEPEEPAVPEKPFSIFGRKSRGNSISDTQFPSGQTKTSTLTMPIEDSQDLYNSILPEITQRDKPTQQSQDFSFMLEDSQSNMLDADGYIKTKSTSKKRQMLPAADTDDIPDSQNDMSELLGLCSGRFMDTQKDRDEKTSRKSLFDENSVSNTQGNMEELMGLCSGVFADKSSTQSGKKGTKRPASDVDSDDESITAFSDNEEKDEGSDIEGDDNEVVEDGDTDHIDSEGEEEEKQQRFTGFTVKNKHGKIRQEFVDEEAELSGSEYDSDENLDLAEEDDIMEVEEGDKEAAKMDQNELRDEVGRIHLKQLIDEDKRELLKYQEMYLPDGDLYSEGGGRVRRFKWSNMEDESQQDMFDTASDGEDQPEETEDFAWRKERYEREQFLKEQQEKETEEDESSKFLKLGKVFLKKRGSVDTSKSSKESTPTESGSETPGFPGSFYKLPQQKRGSFLARSKEALAKIAEMTKPVVNPSAGAKSSGKFTFNVISPDKGDSQAKGKGKQRKAHVAKPTMKEPHSKQPPAKKPKLDTQSSFTENSIFNLF